MKTKLKFNRNEYLKWEEDYENQYITRFNEEKKEFNNDVDKLAEELSYTRYELARAEQMLDKIQLFLRS